MNETDGIQSIEELQDERMYINDSAEVYGGSFTKTLAKLMLRADHQNLRLIKKTWPELWDEYLVKGRRLEREGRTYHTREKMYSVKMPDGSWWSIPADIIAIDRAKYYAKKDSEDGDGDYGTILKQEYEYVMSGSDDDYYELHDWASNNMNWKDVKDKAVRLQDPEPEPVDYQEGWVNSEWEVKEQTVSRATPAHGEEGLGWVLHRE